MDKNKYEIVIYGKNIYREHVLSDYESDLIKIGTNKGCQIRLNKKNFFEEFEFEIIKTTTGWQLNSKNSVYFTIDGVMKLYTKELQHGDEIIVKYEKLNEIVFNLYFFIDFDSVEKNYNREIDISNLNEITIGPNESNDICIQDNLLKQGSVTLFKENNEYYIRDNGTKYGIYVNTEKINSVTKISNYDFLIILGYYFYLKDNKLYTDIKDNMTINNLKYADYIPKNKMKYPKFNRNSRIKYELPNEEIEILPPEKLNKEPKGKLIMSLIPALVMLAATIVLRGAMGGGGTFVIYSVITMGMGIVMSIAAAISNKGEYKKEVKERRESYLKYIEEKEKVIKEIRTKEIALKNKIYIPVKEVINRIEDFDKDLFDRDLKDEDFLKVRLGEGEELAQCKIKFTPQKFSDSKDDLVSIPEQMEVKYRNIDNVPIVTNLTTSNAIGIVGEDEDLLNILNNITLDIIGRQFYKDVKLFYIFDEKERSNFQWLRWIKHVQNEEIGIRNLIYNEESKNVLFEYLYKELLRREEEAKNSKNNKNTAFIIFVTDNKGLYNHPISRFIPESSTYGVTFIFFEESEELLPRGCSEIIKVSNNNEAELINCKNGEKVSKFKFEDIRDKNLEAIGLKLAPIFVDEVTLESELTKSISLFELLGILSIDDLDIEARWKNSKVYKSMAAPLGVKTHDDVIYLDLNEKNHGPHGLVAGTTGSGKSEILQSYILSMATLFHPYEVGFVIIDFKGGGMVNQFKNLPHLLGAITNIDGREITRSLLSIKAELRKRQEIFAEAGVNHIDAYIKKFKNGEVNYPLPHLILIVDEFAELKSDQPEFMKELISAARIGRSLGVHLILATQKPSGVIDDQIWSNSKFKLCLKVQNQNDSNEVLKSPLAAEIKEPGRAYLQVGNNEIFELFQSAYSGAPAIKDEMGNDKEFEINEVSLWGQKNTVFKKVKKKSDGNKETQLEVLVEYIYEHCIAKSIKRLPGICLPPLPDLISLGDVEDIEKNNISIEVAIGLYDDPTQQLQAPVKLNLSEGNLFILGSSQFGKTSLLQTIIRTVAEKYTPEEANIYILDFASMILKNFEALNHVGGVVLASDDEKLKTFTKMMLKEINYRKSMLSKMGISSFTSYKEAGYKDMAQIIICLDNITAFKELYPDRDEELLNICREGSAVGITVVIANSQTNGVGYKYLSNFANKIALFCNDSSEYSSLFDRCRMRPKNTPGRALISINKEIYEYQNYLAFDGEKEIDRVRDMREFIENIKTKYPNMNAPVIPEIPKELDMNFINRNYSSKKLNSYEIPIGLDYETINLETIDLTKSTNIVTIGKESSGKSNFILNIASNLQKNILDKPAKVYVVDGLEKKLMSMDNFGFVEKYTSIYTDLEIIIEEVYDELEYRRERVREFGLKSLEAEPLIIVINNNRDAVNSLSKNKEVIDKYKKIIGEYKNLKVCTIFNDVENVQVGMLASDLLKTFKESKNAFIFNDLDENKFYDLSFNVTKKFKKPLSLGDAYMLKGGEVTKIKTILSEIER